MKIKLFKKLLLLFCLSHLACISASKKEFFTAKSSLFDDDDESDNESDDNVDQKIRLKIWKKQNNAYNPSNSISIEYLLKALKLIKVAEILKEKDREELAWTMIKTSTPQQQQKLKRILKTVDLLLHMQSEWDESPENDHRYKEMSSFLKERGKESLEKLKTDNENLVSGYVGESHPRCKPLDILLIIAAYYSVFSNFELLIDIL